MSDHDDLSPEESAAIEEMMSEPAVEEVAEPEEQPEEAAAEPEEQPEERAEEQPEFKTTREKPPEGFVPHQAMHEERIKRQEAERQLQALMAAEQKRVQDAQKEAEPQWADPLIDPDGFKRYQDHQMQKTNQMVMQQQQAFQQRQMQEARQADVARAESAFRQEAPDYDDAIQHLAQARAAELQMYGMDQQAIARQIQQDSNAIYDSARRLNVSPAKLIYQLSQQRGYTPRQAAEAAANEASKVEALAGAQKQTQGLGSGGGRSSGRLTVSQIAEMSEAEVAKLDPDEVARAFGG